MGGDVIRSATDTEVAAYKAHYEALRIEVNGTEEAYYEAFDLGQRMGYTTLSDNPFNDHSLLEAWHKGFRSAKLGAGKDSKINWVKEGF